MESEESESGLSKEETVRKSDSPSDNTGIRALSDRAQRVLSYVDENPPAEVSIRKIVDSTDLSRYHVSEAMTELENKHFLDVSGSSTRKRYELTTPAEMALEKHGGVCAQKSDSQSNKRDEGLAETVARLHNLSFVIPLHEENYIKWENRERVMADLGDLLETRPESKEFFLSRDAYRIRITGENVIVYLRDEYKGLDVRALKNEAFDELLDLKSWMSEELKLRFKDYSLMDVKIRSQHIAIENHPILIAIEESSQVSLQSVDPVRDEDGRVRLWLDHSEERELEAGNKGNPSGMRELAEDDIEFLMREDIGFKIQHKEGVRALNQLIKVLDSQDVDLSQLGEIDRPQEPETYRVDGEYGFTVEKEGELSEADMVKLSEVSRPEVAVSCGPMDVSERKETNKADSPESSTMSIAENSGALDVRNLPNTTFRDQSGREMTVWFIENLERSESEESERPEVVLRDDSDMIRLGLEELKSSVVSGELSRV